MKIIFLGKALRRLIPLCGLLAFSLQGGEVRTLTDQLGRVIRAEVLSVQGDEVKVKREDGQLFTLSLSKLSTDDQKYLKDFAEREAKNIPPGSVELQFNKARFAVTKNDSGGIIESDERWGYSVTVMNKSTKDIEGLKFEYVLFVKPDLEPGKDSKEAKFKRQSGSSNVEKVPMRSSVTFKTETAQILRQQLKSGYVWGKTGTASVIKDSLYGVWIRGYVGDQMVVEVTAPVSLMQTEKWK